MREVRRSSGGGYDFLILLGLVLFVASATLAAGVFLYSQYLTTSANSKKDQLERAKQAFEPALIQDLTRLDDRMKAADTILGDHVAPTSLLHLLEQLTLQTVSFSSFDFGHSDKGIELSMHGIAQSVNSIALEADLLSRSGVITNPIFSNINRQALGVNFDFVASVNAEALNYAAHINAEGAASQPPPQQQQEPTSPFGTPNEAPAQTQQGNTQPAQQTGGTGPNTGTPPL